MKIKKIQILFGMMLMLALLFSMPANALNSITISPGQGKPSINSDDSDRILSLEITLYRHPSREAVELPP